MVDVLPSDEYVAGLFDGEGWFHISRGVVQGTGRYSYQAHASLALRQREIVELLRLKYGGSVTTSAPRSRSHNPSHKWHVGDRNALAFATVIRPYLRIKGPQALLVMHFQEARGRPSLRVTDETYALYETFYQRMKALNKRGTGVAPKIGPIPAFEQRSRVLERALKGVELKY